MRPSAHRSGASCEQDRVDVVVGGDGSDRDDRDAGAARGDPEEIGRVWRELVGGTYPAMAGIGCTALWQSEAQVEILGVAVIPEERLKVATS